MKKILCCLIVLTVTAVSCEKIRKDEVKVERNCTGTYLKLGTKFYKVCNPHELDGYIDGEEVKVKYSRINDCDEMEDVVICYMAFPNDGWVKVKKVY